MERRQNVRLTTRRAVSCRVPASPSVVTILNISNEGCKAQVNHPAILPTATIILKLGGKREVEGQVVWREGANVGIKFLPKISKDLVRLLTSAETPEFAMESWLKDQFGRALPRLKAVEGPDLA